MFSYPQFLAYLLGAQKNRLIETVLLSTHNICFGWEIRKLFFWYALLTKGLVPYFYFFTSRFVCWPTDETESRSSENRWVMSSADQ